MALLLWWCGPVWDPRRPRCSFSSSGLPPGARARHAQPVCVCSSRLPEAGAEFQDPVSLLHLPAARGLAAAALSLWTPSASLAPSTGLAPPSLSCSGVSPLHYESDSYSFHPGSLAASRAPWGPGPSRMIRTREALALLPAGAGPSRSGHTGQPQPREHGGGGLHVTAHGWARCLREVGAAVCQAGHQGDSSSRPGGAGIGRCRLGKGAQGCGHMLRTAPRPRHLQG